jgi:hypothetical protein
MSKRTFRLLLAGYLVFEIAVSLYHAFFGMRVPGHIVRQLYDVFGQPVPLPSWLALTLGGISIVLFVWAVAGLFLFWPSARPVFTALLLAFAGIAPLQPFYVISGWGELMMHLRLLAHGFIICLIYFGPPREYFSRQSA